MSEEFTGLFVNENRNVPDMPSKMAALQRGHYSAAESRIKEKIKQ